MAGSISVKSLTGSLSPCPCSCLDSMSSTGLSIRGKAVSYFHRNLGKRRQLKKQGILDLSSSFLYAIQHEWRLSAKMLSCCNANGGSRKRQKPRGLVVVDELGGQYDDTFNDVKMVIINYFTLKAVRTVLEQLNELNPPQHKWFNDFLADNVPRNSKRFLQTLVKERQEIAEKVMTTRLSLYSKWIKKCDHEAMYNEISEENLKFMRERLLETIIWPSDDNTKPDQKED